MNFYEYIKQILNSSYAKNLNEVQFLTNVTPDLSSESNLQNCIIDNKSSSDHFNIDTEEFNSKCKDDEDIKQDSDCVAEDALIGFNLNDGKEKVEEISGDDDIFYDIPQTIDYEIEYEKFQTFLRAQFNDLFGITIDDLNFGMNEFKQLFDSFGSSREQLKKNLQIKFQPNIIFNENVQLIPAKPGRNISKLRCRNNSSNQNESLIRFTDRTIQVIANQLEIVTNHSLN